MSEMKQAAMCSTIWHGLSLIVLVAFMIYIKVKRDTDILDSEETNVVYLNNAIAPIELPPDMESMSKNLSLNVFVKDELNLHQRKKSRILKIKVIKTKPKQPHVDSDTLSNICCSFTDESSAGDYHCQMVTCAFTPFGLFILPIQNLGWKLIVIGVLLSVAIASCCGIKLIKVNLMKPMMMLQVIDVTVTLFYVIYRSVWLNPQQWVDILLSLLALVFKIILCKIQYLGAQEVEFEESNDRNSHQDHNHILTPYVFDYPTLNRHSSTPRSCGDSSRNMTPFTSRGENNFGTPLQSPIPTISILDNSGEIVRNNGYRNAMRNPSNSSNNILETPPPSYENCFYMSKPFTSNNDNLPKVHFKF